MVEGEGSWEPMEELRALERAIRQVAKGVKEEARRGKEMTLEIVDGIN